MTFFYLSVLIALSVSALCSLLEATVLSLTPAQIADLSRANPRLGSIWQNFKSRIERPIAVILILNTAAHTIGATLAGAKFEDAYGSQGLLWFSLLFTYLMLQFTEILPKTLGVRFNRRLAPWIAMPLLVLTRLLAPVLFLIHLVNRPFEPRRSERGQGRATMEEIAALAGLARISNLIGPHQERIIHGAFRLSELNARQVMIPVEQVTFMSTAKPLMDCIVAAHLDPHTRFPIIAGDDPNQVLGYVNFKEMIYRARTNPSDHSLEGIIRPVHFALPDQPAAQLMKVFVDQHEHMAVVRDAFGKTLGIVTLEDLIEELVGELEDEFDRLPRLFHPLTGGTYMVGGGVPVRDLAQRLGTTLPEPTGTISAWLIRRLGRLPRVNETVLADGMEFMVRRTRRGQVFEVAVTKKAGPARPDLST